MENQGFRLVEEKKQKKSFFALILSIFTVAGILFCVQQMFVDTKWWFISMVVSVLCCLVIFSTKSTKIVLVYFVLGILLLFAFRTIWISGALDFVNQVTAGFNAVTGESVFYFVVPNYMNRELATVVFFCLTAWFLSGYLTIAIKGKHWVPALVFWAALVSLAVFFEMPSAWCVGAMAFLSLAGIYAHSHTKVDEEKNYLAAFCKMVVIVAVFICFTWNRQLYHKNEIIAELKENITEEANAIRYGEKDLPEGKIKEGIALSEEKRLTVFASEKGKYYLKGYVGSEYHENRWEPLEGKEYGEKYEGIFNRYRSDGFHPLAQLYSYCEAAGRQQNGLEKEEKEGTIIVENTGAYERYQYLPYGVDFSSIQSLDTLYRDLNLQKKFWSNREDEKNTYKICMIDEDSLLKTAGVDWQKQTITDEKVRAYADMEMDYRKFVKKHYMSVDKKEKEEFSEEFDEKKSKLSDITDNIRIVLSELGEKEPEWISADYASTGTMMYRWFNVPARYVEGYLVQGKGKINVTAGDAHAWVEIYKEGVGWIPVDVTPGYYKELPQQKKTSLQQEETVSGQQELEETKPQKQGETKKFPSEKNRLWIIAGIIVILLMVFMTSLWIYRQIVWRRRVREMEQEEIIKRIRCMSAYMKEMYQYLDRSEEEMGADVRKILECLWYDPNAELHLNKEQLSAMISAVKNCQAEIMQAAAGWKKWIIRYWYRLEYPV